MKTLLNFLLAAIIFAIACDVEANAAAKAADYTQTLMMLPFLAAAAYARANITKLKELL